MTGKRLFFIFFGLVLLVSFMGAQEEKTPARVFPPQAIIIASYRGDDRMVREILATAPDKEVRDALGATALHAAMYQTNLVVIKLLLDDGFDPNAKDANGCTPLHLAVTANNVGAARLLLQYGADESIKGVDGLTPLAKARRDEKRAMINLLY